MANRAVAYPFAPKSTAYLEPGCFWPLRLSDGRWSAATVLAVGPVPGSAYAVFSSRIFTAGLLTWTGNEPPTAEGLADADLVDWGAMHVRAITRHGEQVLGRWEGVETLTPLQKVSHRMGGRVELFTNGRLDGYASLEQARSLPVMDTWGLDSLRVIAERAHVQRLLCYGCKPPAEPSATGE